MIKCYLSLHCSVSCLVVFFRATALRSPSAQPSRHLQHRSPCDSHHGLKELFGAATFDLKPLSHTENALLACASRGNGTLQHEKAAEGEWIKWVCLSLSVGLLLSEVRWIITYEWAAVIDGLGMETMVTMLFYKALSNRVNNLLYPCQENTLCSFKWLKCIQSISM